VFDRAIEALKRYLKKKVGEVRQVEDLLSHADTFNHRQLALLGRASKNAESSFTIKSHRVSHNVVGLTRVYEAVDDLEERLRAFGR
jgi:hypothetical protein